MKTRLKIEVAAGVLIIILMIIVMKYRGDARDAMQNFHAANDTISYYKNKNGDMTAEITMYKLSAKDLKEVNKDLYDELAAQKKRYQILSLSKAKIKYRYDTITVIVDSSSTVQIADSLYRIHAPYQDGTLSFMSDIEIESGSPVSIKDFKITDWSTYIDLVIGVREVKGEEKVFITSKNKNVTISDIEGVNLMSRRTKEPSRFGLSIFGGYGLYYDAINSRGGSALMVGAGVSFDFIQFKK